MNIAAIISIFCLAFCFFVFFYTKWYIKRRTTAEALLAEYRNEVYELNAQIDATTDRDLRLIEERITTLRALLEDTDKRISVYVRELNKSRSGEALYTSLGRGIRAALNTATVPPQPPQPPPTADNMQPNTDDTLPAPARQAAAVENLVNVQPIKIIKQPQPVLNVQVEPQTAPTVKETLPQTPVKNVSTAEQIHLQIAGLAAQGFSAGQIAARLDLSISEVDLALNLLDRNG